MATGGVYSCTVPFIILKGSSSLIILSDGTLYVEPTTEGFAFKYRHPFFFFIFWLNYLLMP